MPVWLAVLLFVVALGLIGWREATRARLRADRETTGRPLGRPSPWAIVILIVLAAALVVLTLLRH